MAQDNLSLYLDPNEYIDIQNKLEKLTAIEKTEVVAQGLKDGANIIAAETRKNLKSRVQQHTGNLYSSVSVLTKKKSGKAYAGFKRPLGAASHLVDKGTTKRYTKKGAYRGAVKPRLFHTDAVENKSNEALNMVRESIETSIQRILNH